MDVMAVPEGRAEGHVLVRGSVLGPDQLSPNGCSPCGMYNFPFQSCETWSTCDMMHAGTWVKGVQWLPHRHSRPVHPTGASKVHDARCYGLLAPDWRESTFSLRPRSTGTKCCYCATFPFPQPVSNLDIRVRLIRSSSLGRARHGALDFDWLLPRPRSCTTPCHASPVSRPRCSSSTVFMHREIPGDHLSV
jgi:hypothetical protein